MSLPTNIVGGDGRFNEDDHASHHNEVHELRNRIPPPTLQIENGNVAILRRRTSAAEGFEWEQIATDSELDGTELVVVMKDDAVTFIPVSEFMGGGGNGGVTSHNDLTGRSASSAHPISSITGLEDALDGKAPTSHNHNIGDLNTSGSANEDTVLHGDGEWRQVDVDGEMFDSGWTNLSLAGSWDSFDPGQPAAVRRVGRLVQLAAFISGEAVDPNEVVSGIPNGFRPSRAITINAASMLNDDPLTAGSALAVIQPEGGANPATLVLLDDANNASLPYFVSGAWVTSDDEPS